MHHPVISAPFIPVQREPPVSLHSSPPTLLIISVATLHPPAPHTCLLYLRPYHHLQVPFSPSGQLLFILQDGAHLPRPAGNQPWTSSVRQGSSASPRALSPGFVSSQRAGCATLDPGAPRELDPCMFSQTGLSRSTVPPLPDCLSPSAVFSYAEKAARKRAFPQHADKNLEVNVRSLVFCFVSLRWADSEIPVYIRITQRGSRNSESLDSLCGLPRPAGGWDAWLQAPTVPFAARWPAFKILCSFTF